MVTPEDLSCADCGHKWEGGRHQPLHGGEAWSEDHECPKCGSTKIIISFENDDWDLQMIADSEDGKFDKMVGESWADYEAGRCEEWPKEEEEVDKNPVRYLFDKTMERAMEDLDNEILNNKKEGEEDGEGRH